MSLETRYVLLNKDVPILDFLCRKDEYDDLEFIELAWHSSVRPIGYKGILPFLENRKAPNHREHIRRLLEQYNCDDLEGFLQVTHALSLNDTFWVRRDGEELEWKDVSLYSNEFSEIIREAAFDGFISSTDFSSVSPEFGTDGQYAKCWTREQDGIYLYKSGSKQYEVEPLSEYLASQLSSEICPASVRYDLDVYHGRLISKCSLFTSEEVGLVKAGTLFQGQRKTISQMLDFFREIGGEDAFRRMCVLDAIILNPDRHYGNFGALFDTSSMSLLGMAPVFDHNRALFPELDNDQLLSPKWYIAHCKPRFGTDLLRTAKGLMTEDIRRDLKRLQDFQFQQHSVFRTDPERLEALNRITQDRITQLLFD